MNLSNLLGTPKITPVLILRAASMGIVASSVNAEHCIAQLNESSVTSAIAPTAHKTLAAISSGLLPSVKMCDEALGEITARNPQRTAHANITVAEKNGQFVAMINDELVRDITAQPRFFATAQAAGDAAQKLIGS